MDIAAVREVNDSGMAKRVDGVLLDIFTASMVVQVHDALNEKHQEQFASLPLVKAVNLGWKLVGR